MPINVKRSFTALIFYAALMEILFCTGIILIRRGVYEMA